MISIHALREEGDLTKRLKRTDTGISIHALREEGDLPQAQGGAAWHYFYPRPPRGGRPGISCWISRTGRFLSTPSARRATGLDGLACGDGNADFYPRPPRGGRQTHGNKAPPEYRFLSTPSARRATSCGAYHQSVRHYFYPRPPRGGRPDGAGHGRRTCCISIHALREEGDCAGYVVIGDTLVFLSTPSARRATLWLSMSMMITAYFYPRPPRGGRPRIACAWPTSFIFLSTPSARRATRDLDTPIILHQFLSTPSARRATPDQQAGIHVRQDFYPRPPRGGRPRTRTKSGKATLFLSTPSARRATAGAAYSATTTAYFYPRPPRGGRPTGG